MQGASPLASPGAEPGRHWNREANHAPGGGLVSGVGGSTCRCGTRRGAGGGGQSPTNPAFSLLSCPHPPPRARRALFPAALARPAPGERTISNAEVPLPRFPLSLAAGTALRKGLLSVLRRTAGSLARGARIAEAVSAANGLMQGRRGRSPRQNKHLGTPFPGGEERSASAGWGDRGKKENKRQGQPVTKRASHPNGFWNGKVSRRPAG